MSGESGPSEVAQKIKNLQIQSENMLQSADATCHTVVPDTSLDDPGKHKSLQVVKRQLEMMTKKTEEKILFLEKESVQLKKSKNEIHETLESSREKLKDMIDRLETEKKQLEMVTKEQKEKFEALTQTIASAKENYAKNENKILARLETLCEEISQLQFALVVCKKDLPKKQFKN